MEPSVTEQFKSLLLEEKIRLEKELASFASKDPKMKDDWDTVFPAAASSEAHGSHSSMDEQADIREEYESGLAQEQSLESRLAEVNRALERIQNNGFGACRTCRQPISEERLKANPAAEYDIEHQPSG